MDVKDAPKSPSTKPGVPQRSIASSLKSIIQSRHPNTRRNIKRRPEGPIIYDMIVVKNYDQMDSLRQVLSLPPRIHGPSPVEVQMKNSEEVSALPERVASAAMTASTGETLGKRKCATEPVPPLSDEKVERTIKKRRISIGIQDIINLDMPKSPQVQRQKVYGKRNFPTRRVYALVSIALTV